uniref:Serpentine receptor class gamma n=1 Tax=Meloidogyne hapla TaxID=6305 RepID=A0A1I8B2C3_MELHA
MKTQQTETQQLIEKRLTLCSVITFIGQLLYSIYIIILYISAFQLQNLLDPDLAELIFLTVFNQFAWVNDICTITIPAFMLLSSSEMIKTHVYSIIRRICFLPKINNNTIMVLPKQAFTISKQIRIEKLTVK